MLNPGKFDEKAYDRERKAKQRASGRELYIPVPKNIELRNRCLKDPELLLTTYFSETYDEPFTDDRRDMLNSIWRAALYGGDQAIAAPRGEGKTTLAMDGALCLMLAALSAFPVVIGKNQDSASDEMRALRERLAASERFIEDFPEIGVPLEAVGASTGNARLLTVGGKFIRMYLGVKFFAFPTITNEQLPHWPKGVESVARGQVMGAVGIYGKIRGCKFRAERPTLAIIDDVEDKDSVRSDDQIEKIDEIIEEDIGGMGSSAERIARIYLCTTLNRKCNAFKFTDRKIKGSWNGRRYRKMVTPPVRTDLIEQYIDLRKNRKSDDPDAREAFRFWRDNKEEIERGAIVSNKHSHSKKIHADGEPLELSAIQAYYNRVADVGQKAVSTEIDNDPPETVGPQDNGLTAEIVASRISGLAKRQLPANCSALTVGIDIGKTYLHWVVAAWWQGGGGVITDYGYHAVKGSEGEDRDGTENAIYYSLLELREIINAKAFVDATGTARRVDKAFVDSGTYTNAPYEFCRQVRGPFFPSKGQSPFRRKTETTEHIRPGTNLYCSKQKSEDLWLYILDADYWKSFVHDRFLTPTFDKENMLSRAALSLYQPTKSKHEIYSRSIVGKRLVTEFIENKGNKTTWEQVQEDDHFLDATAYAAAAAEAVGIKIICEEEPELAPVRKKPPAMPRPRHGLPRNPNGWMNRVKRR